MSVSWEPCLMTTIFSWLSRIDFRGAISRPPGLVYEHLASRLHVEHALVPRRDKVDLIVFYSPFGDGEKDAAPVKVWRRYSQVWRSEA